MKIHVVPIFLGDGLRPPATTTMVRLTFGLKNLDGVPVSGRVIDEDASNSGTLLINGRSASEYPLTWLRDQETRRVAETDRQ